MINISQKKRVSAERRVKNMINKSPTKALYTFSKAERFPARMYRSVTDFRYDVGTKKYDKKVSFSLSKRSNFWIDNGVPGPTKYTVKDNSFSQKKIVVQFKRNRQECKVNSIFVPNGNPGPGKYQPKIDNKYKSVFYSIRKKCLTQENKRIQTPGPKYKIQSTMLDENKHLSIYVKRSSTKIFQHQSVFPRKRQQSVTMPTIQSQTVQTSYITNKGGRHLGKSGPFALQTNSKRLIQQIYESRFKLASPGPGQYEVFSQFQGDYNAN